MKLDVLCHHAVLLLSLVSTSAFAAVSHKDTTGHPAGERGGCVDAPDQVVAQRAAQHDKLKHIRSCADVSSAGICGNEEAHRLCCSTCSTSNATEAAESRKCPSCDEPKAKTVIARSSRGYEYCVDISEENENKAVLTDCYGTKDRPPADLQLVLWGEYTVLQFFAVSGESTDRQINIDWSHSDKTCTWSASRYRDSLTVATNAWTTQQRFDKWAGHWDKLKEISVYTYNDNGLLVDETDGFLLKSRCSYQCLAADWRYTEQTVTQSGRTEHPLILKSCDHTDFSQIWVENRPGGGQLVNVRSQMLQDKTWPKDPNDCGLLQCWPTQ